MYRHGTREIQTIQEISPPPRKKQVQQPRQRLTTSKTPDLVYMGEPATPAQCLFWGKDWHTCNGTNYLFRYASCIRDLNMGT